MKKRIYGTETEFGIALIKKDGKWFCEKESLEPYLKYLTESLGGQFLANGSRIYIEGSYHPEYCTAECTNLQDLIAQEKAGERIISRILNETAKEERAGRIILLKNNAQYVSEEDYGNAQDRSPISFGCHENFLIEKKISVAYLKKVLLPFLMVRQTICGSGWVTEQFYQARDVPYTVSQRTKFIGQAVGDTTNRGWDRAILCTARLSEAHSDSNKYQRLHLLLSDSNMSELSLYLKMGTLGILLEMMEEGYPFEKWVGDLMPKDPVTALHWISHDLTGRKPVIELENGKYVSAIDLLWQYVFMMARYERSRGLNPEFSDILKKTTDVLWRLEKREIDPETLMETDSRGLEEELDWLIKKTALERFLQEFDCHWNNFSEKFIDTRERRVSLYDQLRDKDLKYHDVSEEGLYNLRQPDISLSDLKSLKIRTPRIVEREKIREAERIPPQDNRAKLRGDFIRFIEEGKLNKKSFSIDWSKIRLTNSSVTINHINLNNPFLTESEELDALKSALS